jgi:hypothetical protein
MKRITFIFAVVACVACSPVTAQAAFGVDHFDVAFNSSDASPATQAGSHPYAFTTSLELSLDGEEPDGRLKDLTLKWPAGLLADTTAYPRCEMSEFEQLDEGLNQCPLETVVGVVTSFYDEPGKSTSTPVFNLAPAPGSSMSVGFRVAGAANVVLDISLGKAPPYRPIATVREDLPESIELFGATLQLWGDPANIAHDEMRGACALVSGSLCPVQSRTRPLLTLPTSCEDPLESSYEALSWEGSVVPGFALTHDGTGGPMPLTGCGNLEFAPSVVTNLTTESAKSPSGFELSLAVFDEGLTSKPGVSQSRFREVVVVLPQGVAAGSTLRSSVGACSEADFAKEVLADTPEGCPDSAAIGSIEIESPLIEHGLGGQLFRAAPFANAAGDAPMALYVVIKDPELGLLVTQPVGIETDPSTGQLVLFAEELPELPFSDLDLLLAGGDGPLISPPLCGDYETVAELVPWANESVHLITSALHVAAGPAGGPCPAGNSEGASQQTASSTSPSSTPASPIGPSGQVHRRHRCAKGKHRVRRDGKFRCVRRHHRKVGRATLPPHS